MSRSMRKGLLIGVLGLAALAAGGVVQAQSDGDRVALYRPFPVPQGGAATGPFGAWPAPPVASEGLPAAGRRHWPPSDRAGDRGLGHRCAR